jgi:teichuronic acid biosynthesis glycosyltransferase TuaG
MPKVSVIVPIYNAEDTLVDTLNSISNQTFLDMEILMINDCSSDSSGKIMDRYSALDPRFKAIHLKKNYGAPAGPRNIGIDMASGKWIALIDSDDIWHEEKIERQLHALEETGMLFCSTAMFNFSNSKDLLFPDSNFKSMKFITFDMQLRQFQTPTSSVVVSRTILSKVRFDENPKYKAREDVDCFLHCHELIGQSVKINGAMLAYRVRDGQISGNKIVMVKRHFYVLWNYKNLDGSSLRLKAIWYTISHFVKAFFPRYFLKRL